jgi:formylglycine-generating enzyme required for sulfatase activity
MKHRKLFFSFLTLFLGVLLSACSDSGTESDVERATGKTWTNSIGMEFVRIEAGSFLMGRDPNFEEGESNEEPRHRVTISQSFYLGKYTVTQAQWEAVMDSNPSKYKGSDHPVERVSWNDAQTFIRRLNKQEGTNKYRLPTEAEWEYAARAGTKTAYSFGDDEDQLSQYASFYYNRRIGQFAWVAEEEGRLGTSPVGQKQPNPWGLYDMHGNVEEWVQDWYGKDYYASSPSTDPTGPAEGAFHVRRGGGWGDYSRSLRSAYRNPIGSIPRHGGTGFWPIDLYISFRMFGRDDDWNGSAGSGFRLALSSSQGVAVAPAASNEAAQPVAEKATGKTWINSIDMEFVRIEAGSFMMGRDPDFEEGESNETPRHHVTISRPFYLGKYEVTQEQWVAVMGSNPSHYRGSANPVERVSWNHVQDFIRRLNEKEGTNKYRLPTEAEWEYAARAGTTTAYFFGDDEKQLGEYAWYGVAYSISAFKPQTHPVGQKQPNPWGLYDMYGNVWEWVQDWYGKDYYTNSLSTDPTGPSEGRGHVWGHSTTGWWADHVLRGGGWCFSAKYLRSAFRGSITSPDIRNQGANYGFRLALSIGED